MFIFFLYNVYIYIYFLFFMLLLYRCCYKSQIKVDRVWKSGYQFELLVIKKEWMIQSMDAPAQSCEQYLWAAVFGCCVVRNCWCENSSCKSREFIFIEGGLLDGILIWNSCLSSVRFKFVSPQWCMNVLGLSKGLQESLRVSKSPQRALNYVLVFIIVV